MEKKRWGGGGGDTPLDITPMLLFDVSTLSIMQQPASFAAEYKVQRQLSRA